jgi:hypothetical protein
MWGFVHLGHSIEEWAPVKKIQLAGELIFM